MKLNRETSAPSACSPEPGVLEVVPAQVSRPVRQRACPSCNGRGRISVWIYGHLCHFSCNKCEGTERGVFPVGSGRLWRTAT